MARKPTYEELEQRNKELQEIVVNCKQTEETLQEWKKRFMSVTNSIEELIVILDHNLKIQLVNKTLAKAYNISFDKYAKKYCYEFFYGRNDICEGCPAIKVLNEGKVIRDALRYRPDGRIVDRTAYPFIDDKDNITGVIVIGCDITEQKQAEEKLRKSEELLRATIESTADGILVVNDKKEIENNVLTNVKELIEPYLEKIKNNKLDDQQRALLSIMESNINEIVSPFTRKISLEYSNLTPTEIQIANLIRHGSSTKKIAQIMHVSPKTIETHRKNIRRKLGLEGRRANLRSHFLSHY